MHRPDAAVTQRNQARCECGRLTTITPGDTRWEFVSVCACGAQRIISWNHAAAPPLYVGQLDLWNDTNS